MELIAPAPESAATATARERGRRRRARSARERGRTENGNQDAGNKNGHYRETNIVRLCSRTDDLLAINELHPQHVGKGATGTEDHVEVVVCAVKGGKHDGKSDRWQTPLVDR